MNEKAQRTVSDIAGRFDHPMFIVTAAAQAQRAGCLVGFAAQCSISPVRFVVFLSKANRTYSVALSAEHLGVHVVPSGEIDLARLFGEETGDEIDKFERCRWSAGVGGAPLLTDCGDRFVGHIVQTIDAGDHVGFILDPVEAIDGGGSDFLGFARAKDMEPGHPA